MAWLLEAEDFTLGGLEQVSALRLSMDVEQEPALPELRLLMAVLVQAIKDAQGTGSTRQAAQLWLKGETAAALCGMLDMDHGALLHALSQRTQQQLGYVRPG
jgi:hypothetical protein